MNQETNTINWIAARTARMLGGASVRRAAMALLLAVLTTATAWAQSLELKWLDDIWGYTYAGGVAKIEQYKGSDAVVTTPTTLSGNPVKTIGYSCFILNQTMTSAIVSEGVLEIEGIINEVAGSAGAFVGCQQLVSVSLPSTLVILGEYVFYNCQSLSSITLPDNLIRINEKTFYKCTSLASVTLPSSLTSIGPGAFGQCSSLTNITIPNSVTLIEQNAFRHCGLTDVWYQGTKTQWNNVTVGTNAFIKENNSTPTIHYRCTATFDMQGHGTTPAAQTVYSGVANALTAPASDPTAQGWTFGGWYRNAACTEAFNFAAALSDNVTIYAKWTPRTDNVVTFDTGGKGTVIASQTLTTGQTVTEPDVQFYHDATEGKDMGIEGWYTDAGCTTAYDFATAVDHSFTLYAKWAEAGHFSMTASAGGTVALSDAKGRGPNGDGLFMPGQYTLTVTPASGYSFTGTYSLTLRNDGGTTDYSIGGSSTLSLLIDLTTKDLVVSVTFSKMNTYQVFVNVTTDGELDAGTFTLKDSNNPANSYTGNGETLAKVNDGSEELWNTAYDLTLTVSPSDLQGCAMTIVNNDVTTYIDASTTTYEFTPKGSVTINLYYFLKNIVNATLDDQGSNSSTLTRTNNGHSHMVKLKNRRLWKDGDWNTLCLPFALKNLEGTPLAGATVMQLNTTSKKDKIYQTRFDEESGTLNLYFSKVTSGGLEAGVPYIVKWAKADGYDADNPETRDLNNPVFNGVFITAPEPGSVTSHDGTVSFCGRYDYVEYTTENRSVLYLGTANKLYYPQPSGSTNPSMGACRAYFTLNGIAAGDLPAAGAREFVLNFDEDPSSELTGIVTVPADGRDSGSPRSVRTGIYTLDGRRVATDASGFDLKSLRPGLYIVNGKKIVIK